MKSNRRSFINLLLGVGSIGALAATLYPILSYLIPPKIREPKVTALKAGKVDDLKLNSAKIIRFGRVPVILIRADSGQYFALSATCTHLECIVQYESSRKQIICACHNGVYDLSGRNVSGPPPRPLDEYLVHVIDNEVIIAERKV